MPKISPDAAPRYRHHKSSGQAVVTLSGRDFYLGPHGTAASRTVYDRLIAEWKGNRRSLPAAPTEITVVELIAAYVKHAAEYYRGSSEYEATRLSLRPLKPASEFSPLKLKAVRQRMIESDLCRNEINKRIGRIKRMFRWGVENELVSPIVRDALQAVSGLARGRSSARESEPVRPVPQAFVDAVKPFVSGQVWTVIQLQTFTGMRPGEVLAMRTCDLDVSGSVWVYSLAEHKNAWRGHERKIHLGPRAQSVLKPWLRTDLQAFLFQPREAMAALRAERARARKTPRSCGNIPGSNRKRKPEKSPGERYTPRSYHQAIRVACRKAGVEAWHPHQLRHNAATWLRKEFGIDVARVVLGHRSPRITETCAELDHAKAAEVMARVG